MIATRLALVQAAARGFAVEESSEYTDTERIAIVVWHLAHGEGLKTRQVATLAKITTHGAYTLMCRVSRVLPIYQDERGTWQVLACKELEN